VLEDRDRVRMDAMAVGMFDGMSAVDAAWAVQTQTGSKERTGRVRESSENTHLAKTC
jgi:hypothetical protein